MTHWDSCTTRRIILPDDLASVAWGEFIHAVWTGFEGKEGLCPPNFAVCLVDEQCFDILTGAGRQLVTSLRELRAALQEVRQSEGVHDTPKGNRRLYIFTLDYSMPCEEEPAQRGPPVECVDCAAAKTELSSLSSHDQCGYGPLAEDEESDESNYS